MAQKNATDECVEQEIARLEGSEHVALARLERQIANRRRQRMYTLRWLEKRGIELEGQGVTQDVLRERLQALREAESEDL